jgi:hypothetical protein
VMQSHRVAAAWFDSLEPGLLDEGRPLADLTSLQVTPRVASTTRESRLRSAWAVAQRLDELLSLPGVPGFEVQRPTSAPANSRIASAAFMGLSALPEMTEIDDTPQAAAMFDENGTMLQGDAYVEADEAAVDELQRAYENAGHGASQAAPVASASPALSSALHEFEPPAEAPSREFKASTEALSREFKASTEALEADFATGPVLP